MSVISCTGTRSRSGENAADANLADLLMKVRSLSTGVFNGPLNRIPHSFRRRGYHLPGKMKC